MRWSYILTLAAAAVGASAKQVITGFPGLDKMPPGQMSSGYVNVGGSRELFYILSESDTKASTDPLIVWFQGGPGCSGLLGLFEEIGPLAIAGPGKLAANEFSWTKFANVLFLEQPVGVGFSYDTTKAADYTYPASDTEAATNNLAFLQGFLKEHPEFAGRDLWFAGESYGGMYMPTLAQKLIHSGDEQLVGMFKGMMLGNPVMYCDTAGLEKGNAQYPMQFNRFFFNGLVSYETYAEWQALGCNFVLNLPAAQQQKCADMFAATQTAIGVINQQLRDEQRVARLGLLGASANQMQADLDPDDLYQDFCTGNGTLSPGFGNPDDCHAMGDNLAGYLTRKDVRSAIGATSPVAAWGECANLAYTSDMKGEGLIPVLQDIFANSSRPLHVLYYSGDVDVATVPMQTTQACLAELKQQRVAGGEWKPWTVNGWHAGYVETFTNYTFASVKGAGHEVPTYQPLTAFNMAQRFVSQQSLKEPRHLAQRVAAARAKAHKKTQGSVLRAMRAESVSAAANIAV